tara:strand:- start:193 stop:618 length:426 start_codon:yes stop_codon:yes gene_type:complete
MSRNLRNIITALSLGVLFVITKAVNALAQIIESDIDSQPGSNETIQRITSTFEVKRAVIGLLIIAAIAGITFFFYWYKTGQRAREIHAQEYGVSRRMKERSPKIKGDDPWGFTLKKNRRVDKPFRRRQKNSTRNTDHQRMQ